MKRKYWIVLALLFLVALDWFIRTPDARSRHLTEAIEAQGSPKLRGYPYKFRVLKTEGETAFLSTPHNDQVPAFRMLAVLYPDVDTKNPNDPAFMAVEQLLGEVESEAHAIVQGQPGVKDVRRELDREWLAAHHIEVPGK